MMPREDLYEKAMAAYDRESGHSAGIENVIEIVCMEMQDALLSFRPEEIHRLKFAAYLGADRSVERMILAGTRVAVEALGNPAPMTAPRDSYSGGHLYTPSKEHR